MKKRQNIADESNSEFDIKSLIHENSVFFDKLIELIPAKFYLPVDDTDKKWFQGLSKGEKALAKKESRENIKKARRQRLDPEKSSATTLDLLMKNLENEKAEEDEGSDEEEVEINPRITDGDKSATYEELRQRLHRKIEELRGGRSTGGSDRVRKNKGILQKKRKRESESENKGPASKESTKKADKDSAAKEDPKDFKFSHVKLGDEEHGKNKKRKFSKVKELEKAKQLRDAKKDPEKGDIITKKHSWKAAVDRAAGIKVHDDPKLLKQSLKKEKRRQQKNAEKWKERIESQQKMKAEKQQKRSHNIADRIQQKKTRKIAKREKKLMRPGFEGRKEGYINEAPNAGTAV
ncbi:uncharacterized protein LOC126670298 [Mercurialis annua]|uniref:uncharacterized protein LOC126670298 n=1 Tax=Mercurialis annua TaxID=3986 RepID=UPI00215EFDB3|nr:uncharacterized protein LOC126670298 [Mercurialis annua]